MDTHTVLLQVFCLQCKLNEKNVLYSCIIVLLIKYIVLFYFIFNRNELFVSNGGARPSASKILVVITDGESTDSKLTEAVQLAQAKNITRYAIGVRFDFASAKLKKT